MAHVGTFILIVSQSFMIKFQIFLREMGMQILLVKLLVI